MRAKKVLSGRVDDDLSRMGCRAFSRKLLEESWSSAAASGRSRSSGRWRWPPKTPIQMGGSALAGFSRTTIGILEIGYDETLDLHFDFHGRAIPYYYRAGPACQMAARLEQRQLGGAGSAAASPPKDADRAVLAVMAGSMWTSPSASGSTASATRPRRDAGQVATGPRSGCRALRRTPG